ncbi:aluminum-activated malate transporter 7-like [Quercus robur]|uniref:aluminum-activated malate transporter 7-like n=1 Tax=Quercus robur TaxID=38942 RepID=UPI0021610C9D|nr:aluminum-activated malate transporter 7-like [Quercus robur]
MNIAAPSIENAGPFTRACGWHKLLPNKIVEMAKKIKKLGQDGPRRIIHSLKVGQALTLVSLFYYIQPLYDRIGENSIWAVITVILVFEFSVGATLGKGLNRMLATLSAGALGVGVHHLATLSGEKGEPIVLGFFVAMIAATVTFVRFFPTMKARYDYGLLIFILTFSLVSVSGYREDKVLHMTHQRVTTIIMDSFIAIITCICIRPVWIGEELQNLIANNIEKLENFLYEELLKDGLGQDLEFSSNGNSVSVSSVPLKLRVFTIVMFHNLYPLSSTRILKFKGIHPTTDESPCTKPSPINMRTFNASIGHSRKRVKLETSTSHGGFSTFSLDEKLDNIVTSANLARWELWNYCFGLFHPWKQYVKIGTLTRQCAYKIEALNNYLNSEIQTLNEFGRKIQEPSTKICSESGKALRELASAVKKMNQPTSVNAHIENTKTAIENLKFMLDTYHLEDANLQEIIPQTDLTHH